MVINKNSRCVPVCLRWRFPRVNFTLWDICSAVLTLLCLLDLYLAQRVEWNLVSFCGKLRNKLLLCPFHKATVVYWFGSKTASFDWECPQESVYLRNNTTEKLVLGSHIRILLAILMFIVAKRRSLTLVPMMEAFGRGSQRACTKEEELKTWKVFKVTENNCKSWLYSLLEDDMCHVTS